MTTLAPSTSSRPEVEALEDQQQRRHDQDQDQQQQQRPRQRQQPTQQRQPPAAAAAADDEREQHHHHRSSPPHSHPPGLPKPAIDASGAAYESFTSPKLPPSSPTTLSSSPSVSLLHPHVPPSRPLDHASTVAARFRALSTRLKAPAQHLRWKSSSAIPTLDTTSATPSGSSTPTERPNSASAMTSHDTLNPHSASDLLRQAMMQRAAAEDEHDQIGSNSSTPPGAATPRPDLTDKRLPGILHSYFGQVCDSFRTKKPTNSPAPASSSSPSDQAHDGTQDGSQAGESTTEQQQQQQPPLQQQGAGQALSGGEGLPTAPCSPKERREDESPPLLPHERLDAPSRQQQPPSSHHTPSFFYPTPPTSSSSSMHRVSKEEPGDTTTTTTSSGRALSTSEANPPRSRRHTFALTSPLSSILTTPDLPAAHISNPATRRSSQCPLPAAAAAAPRSPSKSSPASRRSSASKSKDLVKKLTEGVSPSQNTPPQTPRTRSHNEKPASVSQTKEKANVLPNGAAVAPPKGKLRVSISEGRGLRPSYDPYVVCQFQQSEYISDGPRHDDSDKKDSLARPGAALAMQRTTSDYGRTMAIPMRSRQSSNSGYSSDPAENGKYVTDPTWEHDAIFDVVGDHSEIDISVYDRSNQEAFLGHVRFCPNLVEYEKPFDGWFPLEPREGEENSDSITGEIHLRISFQKSEKRHVEVNDFEILKLIGKGTFGQVFQVRKKDTRRIYAMKVLSKKVIVQKKEVAHTMGERNILVRTATVDSPFIVGLKFSFQTPTDLFLVTDYMSGGELFWHLQKEGRFLEHRAKFYIAELILALQHLHEHDIVYRDLKPENILLDAKGHIALCDFGLSKANLTDNATTNTFCGTTEYLAPEVLLDEHGYTKMVDFWSLGVLVFEMCCGWSPFYAEDTQQMYKNIAFGKVRFPRDALSSEGRSFVKGLLNRNPKHRLGSQRDAEELKEHPFFSDIDWDALAKKNVPPPFKPKLKSEEDVSNFDPEFTNALNGGASSLNARAAALANGMNPASTPLSPTLQNQFKGFTFVDDSAMEKHFRGSDYPEKMEEDDRDDAEWEQGSNRRGERMSGVMHSNDADEGIFNNGGFDV